MQDVDAMVAKGALQPDRISHCLCIFLQLLDTTHALCPLAHQRVERVHKHVLKHDDAVEDGGKKHELVHGGKRVGTRQRLHDHNLEENHAKVDCERKANAATHVFVGQEKRGEGDAKEETDKDLRLQTQSRARAVTQRAYQRRGIRGCDDESAV